MHGGGTLSRAFAVGAAVCIAPGMVRWLRYPAANTSPLGGRFMGILTWIVLGLIAGAIAKAIMPGKDPGGIIVTMLIGIVGAFIGGFIGNMVTESGVTGLNLWSILLAIVGSLILLWIYRMATRGRATRTL
jgi:uncharacterized membrane protein YeaQ/YmgE (transglycosylase-associated protein family)